MSPCTPSCLPEEESWAIPARILNIMWSDVVPRLVAKAWTPAGGGIANVNDLLSFQAEMKLLPGSATFQARIDDVNEYIDAAQGGGWAVPLGIPGEGGFDFVLSDVGVEVFVPKKPDDIAHLLHFYTFRETGETALGFPDYQGAGAASLPLHAPTGPSQITMRLNAVAEWVNASNVDPACKADVMNCLMTHFGLEGEFRPGHFHDPHSESQHGPDFPDEEIELSMDAYACVLSPTRCWQLAGSVYRGIMVLLPRIVAEIWHEKALAGWDGSAGPGRLYTRFVGAETRDIFAERLETSIPDSTRMRFETYGPGDAGIPDYWGPWLGGVMITNRGVFMPKPQPMNQNANAAANRIYTEIMNGNAGNPVFTDSKQSI